MSKEVGECGKTTEIYVPTVFENYVADIEVDRRQVRNIKIILGSV